MNSLTVGFIYTLGVAWVFCEAIAAAAYGSSAPLLLVSGIILVFFVLLGCLPATDEKTGTIGAVFAVILGLTMTYFAFSALLSVEHMSHFGPSMAVALVKIGAALFFLASGILAVVGRGSEGAH